MDQLTGKITKLLPNKFCGFIKVPDDDTNEEYFFHVSGMNTGSLPYSQLREGMTVEFSPTSSSKGLRAEDVRITEE